MKKIVSIVVAILTVTLILVLAVSCNFFGNKNKGFQISFDSLGGTKCDPILIVSGENSPTIPIPTKPGAEFEGWYLDKGYKVKWSDYLHENNNTIDKDITLYAKWVKVADLTLELNGGSIEDDNIVFQWREGQETIIPVPVRKGHKFAGWYTAINGGKRIDSDESLSVIKTYSGDSATIYAHWEFCVTVEPYEQAATVSINPGSDAVTVGKTIRITQAPEESIALVEKGEADVLIIVSPKPHFNFYQWVIENEEITPDKLTAPYSAYDFIYTKDALMVAKFQGDASQATFKSEDKSFVQSVRYGDSFTVEPKVKPGYVFVAWKEQQSGTPISNKHGEIVNYPYWEDKVIEADYKESSIAVDYEYETNGDSTGYVLTKYTGDSEYAYVPSDIGGCPVEGINADTFKNIPSSVKNIVIPYSINNIQANAFAGVTQNIYFDRGANLNLIKAEAGFTNVQNIYASVSLAKGDLTGNNNFGNALIDDYYVNFFGKYATSDVRSREEAFYIVSYMAQYSIGYDVKFTLNYDFTEGTQNEMARIIKPVGLYKSNSALNSGIAYSYSGKTVTINKMSEKTTARMASTTTQDSGAVQTIPLLMSYEDNVAGSREFAIDACPPYVVINSEQMFYAVENGFKPVFLREGLSAYQLQDVAKAELIYNKARETLNKITPVEVNDLVKVTTRIHDWITQNNKYDNNLLEISKNNAEGSISHYDGFYLDGMFLKGKSVCDGISKAFVLLSRIEGIEAIRVSGKKVSGGGHAWNKVKIKTDNNGLAQWYALDATADDLIINENNGAEKYEVLTHEFFLVSQAVINAENIEDMEKAPLETYVEATGSYNYYADTSQTPDTYVLKIDSLIQKNKLIAAFNSKYETLSNGAFLAVEYINKSATGGYITGAQSTNPKSIGGGYYLHVEFKSKS